MLEDPEDLRTTAPTTNVLHFVKEGAWFFVPTGHEKIVQTTVINQLNVKTSRTRNAEKFGM